MKATLATIALLVLALGLTSEAVQVEVSVSFQDFSMTDVFLMGLPALIMTFYAN